MLTYRIVTPFSALLLGLVMPACGKKDAGEASDDKPADEAKAGGEARNQTRAGAAAPQDQAGNPLSAAGAWKLEGKTRLVGLAATASELYAVANDGALFRYQLANGGEVGEAQPIDNRGPLKRGSEMVLSKGGDEIWILGTAEGDIGKSSILRFGRDADSGALSYDSSMGRLAPGNDYAISADGKHVYVTAPRDNQLAIYARKDKGYAKIDTVELTKGPKSSGGSSLAALGPNDEYLYVTTDRAYSENREKLSEFQLIVYRRDPATGKLEEVQRLEHDRAGVELQQPKALAVSPSGDRVFASLSGHRGEISLFERDLAAGTLNYLTTQRLRAPLPGAEGPQAVTARAIAVSPDGKKLYASSTEDFGGGSFISLFRID